MTVYTSKNTCPHCGGKGIIIKIVESKKWSGSKRGKTEINEEERLPCLTGSKEQCEEATPVRSKFIQLAKRQYQSDNFNIFVKLVSYEAHSLFWINNKSIKLEALIAKIAVKNPSAFHLVNSI